MRTMNLCTNGGYEEAQSDNLPSSVMEKQMGGWLESDDIEDFE
jgi:hypothetical protein